MMPSPGKGRPVRRLDPKLPASAMQTYVIDAPVSTHFREASCAEVACEQAERGWRVTIDLTTDLGKQQGRYIKHSSGRRYEVVEQRDGLVTLQFPGGQECFRTHRVRLDRQETFLVKGGDFRGNPRGQQTRVHTKPEHWIEDFQENTDRLNRLSERG